MEIVDEFIVTLGLDPSNYKKEKAAFIDDLRGTKEAVHRTTRDIESDNRRATESFSLLKNEIVGLFLVAAGGRGITALVQSMVHGAAETGRFAQSIDLATERVSVWEMAVTAMGGSAEDARAGLAALNAEYTNYMLTGRAVHDADLAALGISANDLQSPEQLALGLAERRAHMTQREFTARLQRLGLPDSFIRTLARGRDGVRELLEEQERIGPVTEEQSRTAQQAEREWANLTHQLRSELRPALTWLLESGFPFLRTLTQSMTTDVRALTVAFRQASEAAQGVGDFFRNQWINFRVLRIESELLNIPDTPENQPRRLELLRERSNLRNEQVDIARRRQAPWTTAENMESTQAAGGAGPVSGPSGDRFNHMRGFFVRNGYTDAQARGIAAGIMAESNGDPNSFNAAGGGQGARGIGQWRGPRQRALLRQFGPRPTLDQQLQFFLSELRGGDPGGAAVGRQTSAEGALAAVVHSFFRPGAGAAGDMRRGRAFLSGAPRGGARLALSGAHGTLRGGAVTVGTINVHLPPGTTRQHADAVASEIPRAVARRGVVTQANGGLR